jgi:hypothetical protein
MLAIVTTKIIAFLGMIQRNIPEPDFAGVCLRGRDFHVRYVIIARAPLPSPATPPLKSAPPQFR